MEFTEKQKQAINHIIKTYWFSHDEDKDETFFDLLGFIVESREIKTKK